MTLHVDGWRQLLQIGRRTPRDAAACLIGLNSCSISWRARRMSLMSKMANSPSDSLQHVALIVLRNLQTPWYRDALHDIQLVFPGLQINVCEGLQGLRVSSSSHWSDEGVWRSIHAYGLRLDMLGHPMRRSILACPDEDEVNRVKQHAHLCTKMLKTQLQRNELSERFARICTASADNDCSKMSLLLQKLCTAGPPLHCGLAWVSRQSHRAAISALFAGDWFLARYAANYFCKSFVPDIVVDQVPCRRACATCWHDRQEAHFEDESHVLLACPLYEAARAEFLTELSTTAAAQFASGNILAALCSHKASDWVAFGKYSARVRQIRRRMRSQFLQRNARLEKYGFAFRKPAWKSLGHSVCRHGVFFATAPLPYCPCMLPESQQMWQHARFMPTIDTDTHHLFVAKFDHKKFKRIGVLRAELRRRGW